MAFLSNKKCNQLHVNKFIHAISHCSTSCNYFLLSFSWFSQVAKCGCWSCHLCDLSLLLFCEINQFDTAKTNKTPDPSSKTYQKCFFFQNWLVYFKHILLLSSLMWALIAWLTLRGLSLWPCYRTRKLKLNFDENKTMLPANEVCLVILIFLVYPWVPTPQDLTVLPTMRKKN